MNLNINNTNIAGEMRFACCCSAGFGQGVRRSLFSVAAILGPLWAGGSVTISYYILMGVPLGMLVIVLVRTELYRLHL